MAHVFRHHPLLGTVVELRIVGTDDATAEWADAEMLDEFVRLERVFSAFDPQSELRRWGRGEVHDPSDEFCTLMAAALRWQRFGTGGFNPATGVLAARWRRAADEGRLPTDSELAELAASIAEPRFELVDGRPVPTGDCTGLDLNAIAKGFIVDRALERVAHRGFDAVCVNAGGDLAHRGRSPWPVAIENPLRPYDNEPPVARLTLQNQGLATSGRSRRGVRVAGEHRSHVIDPRTGATVDHLASVSVVAPDAMTADVLATVVGCLSATEVVELVEPMADVGVLVIDRDGRQSCDSTWRTLSGA